MHMIIDLIPLLDWTILRHIDPMVPLLNEYKDRIIAIAQTAYIVES